jgi:hypothetical protein
MPRRKIFLKEGNANQRKPTQRDNANAGGSRSRNTTIFRRANANERALIVLPIVADFS